MELILSRVQFGDFLSDFANEVKARKLEKLSYDKWRPLHLWCNSPTSFSDFKITPHSTDGHYTIQPWDSYRTLPNPVEIKAHEDPDFWGFLHAEYNHRKMEEAFTKLRTSCTINTEAINKTTEAMKNLNKSIKEKENEKTMKFGNFDFGPVDSSVRMSMYGMAIKNASGTYVAYDKASDGVIDVDIFNFEGANKFIYKLPVAIKDVAVGDVVIHACKPMFVQEVLENNRLVALDIFDGEEKTIVLTKSMFGFDFITKVVSLVDFMGGANADTPFGNMLPLLMLGEGKNDFLLPMLMMNQNSNAFTSNPLLLYALMSDNKGSNDNIMPMLLALSAQNPVKVCKCNGKK